MDFIPPRVGPLPKEEWTDPAREVFAFWGEPNAWEEGSKTNIQMVLANHPDLGNAFNIWGRHVLVTNRIPIRERELLILRVAWKLRSAYEWHSHVGYAITAGITLEEIAAVGVGPDAGSWGELDQAVLRAVDEQMGAGRIADATWATLSRHYDRHQVMDVVFSIGHYVMIGWAIASFDIAIDTGADIIDFDLKTRSGRIPGATYKPGETEDWIESRGY